MAMTYIWTGLITAALLFSLWSGSGAAVSAAAMSAAADAVELGLKLLGPMMLSGLLAPLLLRLFPRAAGDRELLGDLSCNMSANLLGLGNAATPAGVSAARRLSDGEAANDELCRLVILNTASLQLLPTTVATLRASLGVAAPFDILPAVWLSSAVSVCVGLLAARFLERWS